jgi:uncharacterized membrane protein YdjX (TVP38/TMEM64 family)
VVSDDRRVTMARVRRWLGALWLVAVATGLYLFVYQRVLIQQQLAGALSVSVVLGGLLYLLLGCVRGFTLVPSTTLVLLGVAFFPAWPLFGLTLVGIIVSSLTIYTFAASLHLEETIAGRQGGQIERLRRLLQRHELPIIIGWSWFPLAPTDLICYVCGALRISRVKLVAGVAIGEGTICAIYIFAGDRLLRALLLK